MAGWIGTDLERIITNNIAKELLKQQIILVKWIMTCTSCMVKIIVTFNNI